MPPVVVPIVAPFLIAFGVPGVTALSTAIAVGTGLAALTTPLGLTVLSIGFSLASNALTRASLSDRGKVGAGLNSNDIRLNTRQEVPPQRWIVGEVRVGGPLFFEESITTKYYQGFLLSEGPITEVVEIFNSQERIAFGSLEFGGIHVPSTNLDGGANFVGNVRISLRRGMLNQPIDPLLDEAFPELANGTFRQRGVATLVFEANSAATFAQFERLWGTARRPNPVALVRGVPIYDPRNPSHILPSNPDDLDEMEAARLTWDWTNNAALVQADYLWRKNGGRIPLGSMDWDRVAASADYDDALIGTKEGVLIKRHTIDGVITAGQNPTAVLQSLLTANRGFVLRQSGRVWVQSSQPVDPVVTITDDDLVGGLEFRRSAPKRALLNRVRCRFVDPRQAWTTVDGPIRDRPDWRAQDGDLYEAAIDLPWTSDYRRAQRLQKAFLEESRIGRTVSATVRVELLGLRAGDAVRFDSKILPRINGIYRIMELGFAEGLSAVTLTCAEYDANIERNWVPADEQDFTLPDLEASS